MSSSLRIIVTGLVAQHHTLAGVTWDYIQYAIGLHRLGHEVYYFEDTGEWPYNLDGGPTGNDWVADNCKKNVEHLNNVLARYGLQERWAYHFPAKSEWYGLSGTRRKEIIRTADLLINVSGTLESPEKYRDVKTLAYIDSDPGFTQVKLINRDEAFAQRVAAHDIHFSFGEQLPTGLLPTEYRWLPTRTPIVLSEWQTGRPHRETYTTVMNWTSYKPLQLNGRVFGQKDVEFVQFLDLPRQLKGLSFEVAVAKTQHKNWQSKIEHILPEAPGASMTRLFGSPREMLTHYGWKVVDPAECCGDIDTYRRYIEQSKGEWSVAKGGYVTAQPGWFSCRSACYLAAGRPVAVQSTGFESVLPAGEGIVPFRNLEEAIRAIKDIEHNYSRHAEAARAIAEDHFDAGKVLKNLIETALQEHRTAQITQNMLV
ncbi:MAG: hypothetical protein L6Q97_01520 [Thermoanaerobaculia bacterium]|nr:hypothetical protein [Thermoanaerobaculia bacterium]